MSDAVEKVARLLDPQSWRVMDEGLASMLRKHKGQNIGYDPENFKHPQSIKRANEIIDTLKFLGWVSPADLAARDAEVTRMALERAAAACGEIANLRNGRGNFFFDRGDQGSAICERHEAIGAEECKSAILALAPPATGMKLVPVEPTQAMLDAMHDEIRHFVEIGVDGTGRAAECSILDATSLPVSYRAMLAAVTVKP